MEERREGYIDLNERLDKIERQTNGGMKAQFDDLKNFHKSWIERHDAEAREFRVEIRNDVRELNKTISERPCIAHTEQINSLRNDKTVLVTLIIALIVACIIGLVSWGSMYKQVEVNTARWEKVMSGMDVENIK